MDQRAGGDVSDMAEVGADCQTKREPDSYPKLGTQTVEATVRSRAHFQLLVYDSCTTVYTGIKKRAGHSSKPDE